MSVISANAQSSAQKWDKETKKAFKKAASYSLMIDFSDMKISGLDSAEFVSYYCDKKQAKPEFLGLVLKKFKHELASAASKVMKKSFLIDDSTSDFVFSYRIYEITDNAGLTGDLSIYPRGKTEEANIYDFKIKDGKWNDFDVLLLENAEKLGKRLIDISYSSQSTYMQRKATYEKK